MIRCDLALCSFSFSFLHTASWRIPFDYLLTCGMWAIASHGITSPGFFEIFTYNVWLDSASSKLLCTIAVVRRWSELVFSESGSDAYLDSTIPVRWAEFKATRSEERVV